MVVISFNECRVTSSRQVVKLLRFTISSDQTKLRNTLHATLAVLGVHLVRYLQGVGHPSGCDDILSTLSLSAQKEISLMDPTVLRASLLLRAMSDYDRIPMDSAFTLDVSYLFGTCITYAKVLNIARSLFEGHVRYMELGTV
jgi:hypothetical protein